MNVRKTGVGVLCAILFCGALLEGCDPPHQSKEDQLRYSYGVNDLKDYIVDEEKGYNEIMKDTPGLEDCTARIINPRVSHTLIIVRCPHSTTTSTFDMNKQAKESVTTDSE